MHELWRDTVQAMIGGEDNDLEKGQSMGSSRQTDCRRPPASVAGGGGGEMHGFYSLAGFVTAFTSQRGWAWGPPASPGGLQPHPLPHTNLFKPLHLE